MRILFTLVLCLLTSLSFFTNTIAAQCTANIVLSTQTDIDNFQTTYGCSTIEGGLMVQTNGTPAIVNLDGLSGIETVTGDLQVTVNPSLTNVNGLNNVTTVGGNLIIGFNPILTNVDALANVTSIGNNLTVALNQSLTNIDGLLGVQDIYGTMSITVNSQLTNLDGLNNLQFVGQTLNISQNAVLPNLNGLSNVTLVGQDLIVNNNPTLSDINGMSSVGSVGLGLTINDNPLLDECCGIYELINTEGLVQGTIDLSNNLTNCSAPESIVACLVDFDLDGFDSTVDCNDTLATCYPGAPELCDGLDNNCDGIIPSEEFDNDGDGVTACEGDWDDTDPNSYPNAPEICDGIDNDGDGNIPAEEMDNDGDGFSICEGDFDDDDANSYVGAPEICDGLDNDGDGDTPAEELDNDGDGYASCEGDFDDNDATVYPGATELCDGIDNDCDNEIDEDLNCDEDTAIAYTESYGLSTEYEWIERVKLESIKNTSGDDIGYGDYTDIETALAANSVYKIHLKPGFSGYKYWEFFRVWVDWNQDGDFDDAGELEVQTITYRNTKRYFRVPADALPGKTRMRVAMKYGWFAESDEIFDEGEVEDYTIEVLPPIQGMVNDDAFDLEVAQGTMETELNWYTEEDTDVEYYEIQTSVDGVNFETIETVESLQSEAARNYEGKHSDPEIGANYYRVTMVDNLGEEYRSEVKKVNFDVDIDEVIVYPNPTDGILHLSMKDFTGKQASIRVYDHTGKTLKMRDQDSISDTYISFDVTTFESGTYYMSIQIEDYKLITKQFVVIKK